eukprot:13999809-Alexandrium_andersonii.AAC.1
MLRTTLKLRGHQSIRVGPWLLLFTRCSYRTPCLLCRCWICACWRREAPLEDCLGTFRPDNPKRTEHSEHTKRPSPHP